MYIGGCCEKYLILIKSKKSYDVYQKIFAVANILVWCEIFFFMQPALLRGLIVKPFKLQQGAQLISLKIKMIALDSSILSALATLLGVYRQAKYKTFSEIDRCFKHV